jgi:hypothetical protein
MEYYQLIKKTSLFLITLVILDVLLGGMARYSFFTQKSGKYYRMTYAIEQTTDSLIIFGSSHAINHYIPSIIEDSIGFSCYNAGIQGQGIMMFSTIQKILIQRYHPKIVLLNIDPEFLQTYKQRYDLLSDLYPYYFKHKKIIGDILKYKSKYERIKLLSELFQYNSTIVHIIKYWFIHQNSYKGYRPLKGEIPYSVLKNTNSKNETKNDNLKIDTVFVSKFKEFINTTLQSDAALIFMVSPVIYKSNIENNKSFALIKEITKKFDIPMLNYRNDPSFLGKNKLFRDESHLNGEGAQVFSKIVAHDLKQMLKQDNKNLKAFSFVQSNE